MVSSDGKMALSGESVIFIINGKTSTVKTDKNGIVKIKITEIPKKYTVTTIFNGKTYKVKTKKNGITQKTLKKNVIKKLKKGKTYTLKVTYLKDTIKTTVKVK